ncbi:hypothetical protein PTTG_25108 [Puccinia triticina 1-1 BBBD Race 1]|uniref:Uncharacterized protein n=2 Tax=Puccinia triticina TaxID=208348 RepID=A0A180H540_PUCT1|nr:uncharacterized protein PtA15_9A324 [Puccinia triticina]OAV99921.1 hypothetical protein PTTG_25108 [Puccinia triticina 1-1 BBBD Race 1]WAQ88198.1 hypothetical protein PtA15_9A324 [Puccinia triticina]WAR60385.1 hypothetical protein PtB15_9B324 [Puccinia triticina]
MHFATVHTSYVLVLFALLQFALSTPGLMPRDNEGEGKFDAAAHFAGRLKSIFSKDQGKGSDGNTKVEGDGHVSGSFKWKFSKDHDKRRVSTRYDRFLKRTSASDHLHVSRDYTTFTTKALKIRANHVKRIVKREQSSAE